MTVTLHLGDCLDVVPTLPPQSVDAIITDLPYGTTACKWDTIIPFPDLWRIVKHVLKPRGAFVTTASQPFTSALVMSNPNKFNCEWIWNKHKAANFPQVKNKPLRTHENVIVFGGIYIPQKEVIGKPRKKGGYYVTGETAISAGAPEKYNNTYYPKTILDYSTADNYDAGLHPTQKPVALYEYLIKTYTNEGETVLDFTMGSGTTGVSCVNTGRSFIGVEKDPEYFTIAEKRIKQAQEARQLEF